MSNNFTSPFGFITRSPAVLGVTCAAVGSLVWVLLEQSAIGFDAGSPQPALDAIFVALLLIQAGYFIAAVPLLHRAMQRCLGELEPVLDHAGAQAVGLTGRFENKGLPALRWTLPLGALIVLTLQEAQFMRITQLLQQPSLAFGQYWLVLVSWATWTLALSCVALVVRDAAALRRLGREFVAVDLMRIEQLTAFSRYGLQLAATVVGLMALWAVSVVLITSFVGTSWAQSSSYVGVAMVLFYITLAVTVFVFPQLGIRERIRNEKGLVYGQLTRLLPHSQETVLQADTNPERLAALLSSRDQIQALPEWPAGQHTRLRLTLYLFVPLLSWSAAALVEEFISRLLS